MYKFELRNAAGEDFIAVENEHGYGCDVYPNDQVIDWQDGNGIIARGDSTRREVLDAVEAWRQPSSATPRPAPEPAHPQAGESKATFFPASDF